MIRLQDEKRQRNNDIDHDDAANDADGDGDGDSDGDGDGDGKYHHSFYLVMWLYERRVKLGGFQLYFMLIYSYGGVLIPAIHVRSSFL